MDDGGSLDSLKVAIGDKVRDALRKSLITIMLTQEVEKQERGKYIATKIAL